MKVLRLRLIASMCFFHVSKALVVLGSLIVDISRSHADTSHSVETFGRVIGPLRRSLPDNIHSIHNRQTPMYMGRFEPAIPAASQQQLTHALDRADTGNGFVEVSRPSNANSCPHIQHSTGVCVCVCVCACVRVCVCLCV